MVCHVGQLWLLTISVISKFVSGFSKPLVPNVHDVSLMLCYMVRTVSACQYFNVVENSQLFMAVANGRECEAMTRNSDDWIQKKEVRQRRRGKGKDGEGKEERTVQGLVRVQAGLYRFKPNSKSAQDLAKIRHAKAAAQRQQRRDLSDHFALSALGYMLEHLYGLIHV